MAAIANAAGRRCVSRKVDFGVGRRVEMAQIASTVQTSKKTIAYWKARFEEAGMDGLEARHKGSQPRAATAAVQARLARRVQQKPTDGSTHWSCRKLAADLKMSHATVQRILAQAKLQPYHLDRYMASNDPCFE